MSAQWMSLRWTRRRRRHLRRLVLAFAAVLAAVSALSIAAPGRQAHAAPDQITWSVQPSSEAGPDQRVSFRYSVAAGGTVQDRVAVSNYSQREVTFALYASDGVTTPEGVFDLLPSSEAPVDAGSWVSLEQSQVTVPAGGQAIVPFTLTVPPQAAPGDHPAGIVATVVTSSGTEGAPVSVERRVGARIHLRVDGEVSPTLEVTGLSTSFDGGWDPGASGDLDVEFDVSNTGNVRLGGSVSLTVRGPLGVWERTVSLGQIDEILPGFSYHVTTTLPDVPALVMLTPVIEIAPVAVGQDVIDAPLEPVSSQEARSWAMPWLWTMAVLIVVGFGTLAWQSRGRQRRRLALAVAAAQQQAAREASSAGAGSAGASGEPSGAAQAGEADGPAGATDAEPVNAGPSHVEPRA